MPFFVPLIALITGILIGNYTEIMLWGIVSIGIALISYLWLLKRASNPIAAVGLNRYHHTWIFFLFCGIGVLDSWYHLPMSIDQELLARYDVAEGEVIEAKSFNSGDRLKIRVSRLTNSDRENLICKNLEILLHTKGFSASYGDVIIFPSRFSEIKDNPNYRPNRSYSQTLRNAGVKYSASVLDGEIKRVGYHLSLKSIAEASGNKIASKIENSSLSRPASEFIVAVLLGDKSLLSSEFRESFSNAGVAHVLALSGMHVAIIMGIILSLLFPLKFTKYGALSNWLAILIIWLYAFFSGLAPSTVRACIMASFVVASLSIERKNVAGNALLGAAFIILLFSPSAMYDAGMQLSFICVAAILAFAEKLNTVSQHMHPRLYWINSMMLVSIVATAATWILIAYYFERLPLLFLPINLILLPLLPGFMWCALIYTLFLIVGIDIAFLSKILDFLFSIFTTITNDLSLSGRSVVEVEANYVSIVAWALSLVLIGYALHNTKRKILLWIGGGVMIISLISVVIFNQEKRNCIILQDNYADISLVLYDGHNERVAKFPRNAVSKLLYKGVEIVAIDCDNINDTELLKILECKKEVKRFIIMGDNATSKNMELISGIRNYDKIILHPSIKRKMELELLKEANKLLIEKPHSLRLDGPLMIEF